MTIIVALLGALIVLLGLVGLARPDRFRALFTALDSQSRFIVAIGTRLAMGGLLIWLADELRHSYILRVLGFIAIFAAIALLFIGRDRLDRLIDWWLSRSDGLLRLSAFFAVAFGVFLIYVTT